MKLTRTFCIVAEHKLHVATERKCLLLHGLPLLICNVAQTFGVMLNLFHRNENMYTVRQRQKIYKLIGKYAEQIEIGHTHTQEAAGLLPNIVLILQLKICCLLF